MNATGSSGRNSPEFRVLFVGPPEWRDRAENALDGVERSRGESARSAAEAVRLLSDGSQCDCVVSSGQLDDASGPELAERGAVRRAEIVEAVCERLSAEDRFAFAWSGEATAHGERLCPREWAGDDREYLDGVSLSTGGEETHPEPAVRTCRERSMTVVGNVADRLHDASWCKEAVSRK